MRLHEIRNVIIDLDKLCYIEPLYTSRGKHLILSFGSGNLKLNFNDFEQANKTLQELINVWKQEESFVKDKQKDN